MLLQVPTLGSTREQKGSKTKSLSSRKSYSKEGDSKYCGNYAAWLSKHFLETEVLAKCDHYLKETKSVIGNVEIKSESLRLHSTVPSFHNSTKATPEEAPCFVLASTHTAQGPEASLSAGERWQESTPPIHSTRLSQEKRKPQPEHSISFSPACPRVIAAMALSNVLWHKAWQQQQIKKRIVGQYYFFCYHSSHWLQWTHVLVSTKIQEKYR